ncbi:STAS domain-containing protein [Streptomyces sp. NPDC001744]|uniref:STAS domain-containing protein n=1 Tax=Streptomyces sp. NPDC001744 TaxID=3364606 RepID=UPI0036B41B5A
MNHFPSLEFTLGIVRKSTSLYVSVGGEFDYDTCDELVDAVTEHLSAGGAPLRDVRLGFGGLTHIDSSGLAALLLIHRRVSARGAALHLDDRPDFFERMLRITNVLDHLTGPVGGEGAREDEEAAPPERV